MSTHPPVDRRSHRRFCDTEQWTEVRDARGRPVGHHVTLEFPHPDGRTLRTRISRPINTTPYGPGLAAIVLRDQVEITRDEFWSCVTKGILPPRKPPVTPKETIPASIVRVLRSEIGLTDREIATLTRAEAIQRANNYWATTPLL